MIASVSWNERALKIIRTFPEEVKDELGFLIHKLQMGEKLGMPQSRSMPSLGMGCHELRVKDGNGTYRVFYYLKIKNNILIFHAFQKKTEKTSRIDLEIGKNNLKEMLNEKN